MAMATPGIMPVRVTIADVETAAVAVFAVLRIASPPVGIDLFIVLSWLRGLWFRCYVTAE
jgi:hypothetical protein